MPLNRNKVIFIVGPTAIGKTALALSLARKIGGEIISCDSMQVYKGFTVLSQAPSKREAGIIKYHLIKFLSPKKDFSAAKFRSMAEALIKDIQKRGKAPIVVGGSGLYVKALIDGLFKSPEADTKLREKFYKLAERYGNDYLYDRLLKKDPEAAKGIHKNDTRRIVRALEICSAGKTMTELKKSTKGIIDKYDVKMFGLTAGREAIYSNINRRVDSMMKAGALREVKKIYKHKLSRTAGAMIGLRELTGCLKGEHDFDTAVDLMKRNTRRFAKRQLTWFRADHRIRWFDMGKMNGGRIVNSMAKEIKKR